MPNSKSLFLIILSQNDSYPMAGFRPINEQFGGNPPLTVDPQNLTTSVR